MAISGRRRVGLVVVVAALAVAAIGVVAVRADPAPNLPPIAGDQLLASSLAALARPFTISGEVAHALRPGDPADPIQRGRRRRWRGAERPRARDGGPALQGVAICRRRAHRTPVGPVRTRPRREHERRLVLGLVGHVGGALRRAGDDARAGGPPARPRSTTPISWRSRSGRSARSRRSRTSRSTPPRSWPAGPAYDVVLTPTSTLTLIGRIDVAIDAETRLPLRFQVFPRGSDAAAIEAGFTSVSFEPIDPSMFSFTPPPGTTVRQAADVIAHLRAAAGNDGAPPVSDPHVFGRGFDLRVAVQARRAPPGRGGPAPSVRGTAGLGHHGRA